MASKAKIIGSIESTQPKTAVEERDVLLRSTREEEIRHRAYEIYVRRGAQPNGELEDWIQAEREENRWLYLSYLEFCNEHDVERMASFYAPTIKVNDVPMDPATVAAQFPPLFSAFPDWHWEIRHLVVDGDNIAVHFTVTGSHRGLFREIEATGRRVTTSEFTVYRVEDGRFAEVWDLTDLEAMMKQIRQG
jgi:predicted ester cyclase